MKVINLIAVKTQKQKSKYAESVLSAFDELIAPEKRQEERELKDKKAEIKRTSRNRF